VHKVHLEQKVNQADLGVTGDLATLVNKDLKAQRVILEPLVFPDGLVEME
jgi:hypothetical protein